MNALYPVYKEQLLRKEASWLTDTIKIALWNDAAVYDDTNSLITDILGTQIADSDQLANKSVDDGFAISDPVDYFGISNVLDVAVAIIYRSTDGSLIAYLDQVNGFAFEPVGLNYRLSPGGPGGSYFAL